eukprot:525725-Ditylum_brightwellii.AAC.1
MVRERKRGRVFRIDGVFMHKGEIEQRVLETYIKAFVCEPTNEISDKDKSYQYLYTFPTEFPLYLKGFTAEGSSGDNGTTVVSHRKVHIVDGPAVLTCVEPGNGEHVFLEAEEYHACVACHGCVCSTCVVFKDEDKKKRKKDKRMIYMK